MFLWFLSLFFCSYSSPVSGEKASNMKRSSSAAVSFQLPSLKFCLMGTNHKMLPGAACLFPASGAFPAFSWWHFELKNVFVFVQKTTGDLSVRPLSAWMLPGPRCFPPRGSPMELKIILAIQYYGHTEKLLEIRNGVRLHFQRLQKYTWPTEMCGVWGKRNGRFVWDFLFYA